MSKKIVISLPKEIKEDLHEMSLDTEHKGDVADLCLSILKDQAANVSTIVRAKKLNGNDLDVKKLLAIKVDHVEKLNADDIVINVSDLTFSNIENVYRLQKYQIEHYPFTFNEHINAMIEATIGPQLKEFYKKQMDKADESVEKQ